MTTSGAGGAHHQKGARHPTGDCRQQACRGLGVMVQDDSDELRLPVTGTGVVGQAREIALVTIGPNADMMGEETGSGDPLLALTKMWGSVPDDTLTDTNTGRLERHQQNLVFAVIALRLFWSISAPKAMKSGNLVAFPALIAKSRKSSAKVDPGRAFYRDAQAEREICEISQDLRRSLTLKVASNRA
ncbi:hypothetical protein CERSUDRAFT_77648 [Gelatoporia subvermispora B]|uniref:Uncharacterized protein n=1 Tax=Ceriporiopsis subvermispora (strain B) TaxID=914234 RepID=M2R1C9_CERS8|nr:hypothetical protein CERSUDRAFT_77648 [Gelatoporia subvermispora B]